MKAFWNRYKYWIKWILSILLLGVVLLRVDYDQLTEGFRTVAWWYYLLAFLNVLLVQALATLKWNVFLPNHTFKELFILNLISRFYSFALPSTITGDVVKVMKAEKRGHSTTNIASGVLLDKILGMMALGILLCVSLYITPYDIFQAFLIPTVILLFITLVAVLTLYTPFPIWLVNVIMNTRIGQWSKLKTLLNHLRNSLLEIKGLIGSNRIVILCFVYSMLYQLSILISSLILNELFQLPLTIFEYLIISAVTQLIMILPISMGGIGVKDVSFVILMASLGISQEVSVTMTIVNYPILILMVVIGYIIGHFHGAKRNEESNKQMGIDKPQ